MNFHVRLPRFEEHKWCEWCGRYTHPKALEIIDNDGHKWEAEPVEKIEHCEERHCPTFKDFRNKHLDEVQDGE